MKKYFTKKVITGIVVVFLGLGITFGDEDKMKYYMEQVTTWISNLVDSGTDETTE